MRANNVGRRLLIPGPFASREVYHASEIHRRRGHKGVNFVETQVSQMFGFCGDGAAGESKMIYT